MDIKQLEYFQAVVEEGSISAAARRLHLTQPPLSLQLRLLEEELGIRLLERGPRKVSLTDAGKLLYKRAAAILEMSSSTVRELEDYARGLSGVLRLGTVSTSGPALFHHRIPAFHAAYPNVRFEIQEGNTFELLELLRAGIIETAVVRTPFQEEGLGALYLEEEPMAAVGLSRLLDAAPLEREEGTGKGEKPEDRRLLAGEGEKRPSPEAPALSLVELAGRPLILYRRFEKLVEGVCRQAGFVPDIVCRCDDARSALMWARAGVGVALVPLLAAREQTGAAPKEGREPVGEEALLCRPIDSRELTTRIAAVWKDSRYLSELAARFLELFR